MSPLITSPYKLGLFGLGLGREVGNVRGPPGIGQPKTATAYTTTLKMATASTSQPNVSVLRGRSHPTVEIKPLIFVSNELR